MRTEARRRRCSHPNFPSPTGGRKSKRKTTNQERKHNMKTILKSIAAILLLATSAFAGNLVNVSGASNAAVSGYDPVAFFTDSKPVNGSPFITAEHQGATYFF